MRPVLNRLLDLQKIYGASAEGYWQAAFTGLSLETHPQLGGDVTIDASDVRNQLENYVNSLQRYLALTGMSAHTLAPTVSDPSSQIDKHIEAICIQLGIPKRVFMGSERGELASSQDDASWNDRLKQRQNGYLTPRVIVPFVDRLISVGVLPEPDYVAPPEPEEDEFGEAGLDDEFGQEDAFDPNATGEFEGNPDEQDEEGGEGEEDWQDIDEQVDEDVNQDVDEQGEQGEEDDEGLEEEKLGEEEEDETDLDEEEKLDEEGLDEESTDGSAKEESKGYSVVWPDLDSNTDLGKAQVAAAKVQAIGGYVGGNMESVMPLLEFYVKIMGMSHDEAASLVKAAEAEQAKAEAEQVEQGGFGEDPLGQDQGQGGMPPQFGGPPNQPDQFGQQPEQFGGQPG